MISDVTYAHPEGDYVFKQQLFLTEVGYTPKWFTQIIDTSNDRRWEQRVNLDTGVWTQWHYNGDTLIWEDTWNMDNTAYNPFDRHARAVSLMDSYSKTVSAGVSKAGIATATLTAIALGALVYGIAKKNKAVAEREEEINQPLL